MNRGHHRGQDYYPDDPGGYRHGPSRRGPEDDFMDPMRGYDPHEGPPTSPEIDYSPDKNSQRYQYQDRGPRDERSSVQHRGPANIPMNPRDKYPGNYGNQAYTNPAFTNDEYNYVDPGDYPYERPDGPNGRHYGGPENGPYRPETGPYARPEDRPYGRASGVVRRVRSNEERAIRRQAEEARKSGGFYDQMPSHNQRWSRFPSSKKRRTLHDMATLTRNRLQSGPIKPLTGVASLKHKQSVNWAHFKVSVRNAFSSLEVWRGSFKEIEGHFGTGVMSYFRFVKWMMFLNIYIAVIVFCVVTIPQLVLDPDSFESTVNTTTLNGTSPCIGYGTLQPGMTLAQTLGNNATTNNTILNNITTMATPASNQSEPKTEKQVLTSSGLKLLQDALCCSSIYQADVDNTTHQHTGADNIIDVLQGTGFMERTILFYGYYFNKTYIDYNNSSATYNMPLAYILATAAYFAVSLVLMVRNTAKGFKATLVSSGDKYIHYTNSIFCGWDFALSDEKAGKLKHKSLWNEFRGELAEDRRKEKARNRTTSQKCKLYSIRTVINVLVIAMLGGSFYLIIWVTQKTSELSEQNFTGILELIVQFLPSITITVLNMIVPLVFSVIVAQEDLSPDMEIRLTLLRTVFLRLASIGVLLFTIFFDLRDEPDQCSRKALKCWETYVGQQLYKLVVLDFLVIVAVTFLVQFPRKFIVSKFQDKLKLIKWVGFEEFEIPKNVIDIVYSQTLCWLGGFFCPLIPAITFVKCFFFFYTKKLSLIACIPSSRPYKASRSNFFFTVMLLVGFVFTAVLPVGYCIAQIRPSQGCGPFRVHSIEDYYMFTSVVDIVNTWPTEVRQAFAIFKSPMFYIPAVILLSVWIYYNTAVTAGHKRMIELLKIQLALEGQDKQFLLARVQDAVKKGEIGAG